MRKRKREEGEQKTETYTVQTSWTTFCKSILLKDFVKVAVPVLTRAIAEAWLVLGVHCLRMYDENIRCTSCADAYLKDQMLYYRALALTFEGGKSEDDKLQETYNDLFAEGIPAVGYAKQRRLKGAAFTDMINAAARVMKTNFVNHVEVHFQARHERYVRWKVAEASETENLQFFSRSRTRTDSAVRLVRTLTLWYREDRVRDVLVRYPCLIEIPEPCIRLLEKLVEQVREDMGEDFHIHGLGYKVRWMRFMLRSMEVELSRRENNEVIDWPGGNAKLKLFSMVPGGGFRSTFVQLDESILRKFLGCKEAKERSKDSIIHEFFDLKRVLRLGQETQGRRVQSMKTNGCNVSVVLTRLCTEEGCSKKSRVQDVPEFVVGVDPGRNQLVRHGLVGHRMNQERTESTGVTSKRFYQEAGYAKRTFVTAKDMKREASVASFNAVAPTSKTADPLLFRRRVVVVLDYIGSLVEFHGRKKYLKLRWNASVMRKKAIDRVCKEISGDDPGTTVAFGDASVSGGRGLKGPVKEIKRRLSTHHCRVVDVDEFRTSLICSKCSHRVEEMEVSRRKVFQISEMVVDRIKPHALRVCSNPLCRTVWDRDVNALRNIGFVCLYKMVHNDVAPAPFVRSIGVEDED